MSMTPAANDAARVAAASDGSKATVELPANKPQSTVVPPAAASSASIQGPAEDAAADDQEEIDEQAHLFGRFVLFNAVPSSLISGVVHFVLFLVLALTSMAPPPEKKTLELNAAAVQKTDSADELANESIQAPTDQAAADERTEAAQQVLQ